MSISTTKRGLIRSLKDREFRAAFNLENVYTTISFQLRALREQREMSQGEFGQGVKPRMAQERISILEDPNAESKPTLNTLLRLADAADVGLEVRFVPFSTVLNRSVHTNFDDLPVLSFEDELASIEAEIAFELALEAHEALTVGPVNHSTRSLGATVFEFPRNTLTETAMAMAAAAGAANATATPTSTPQAVGY